MDTLRQAAAAMEDGALNMQCSSGFCRHFLTHAAPRLPKTLSTKLFKIVLREMFVGSKEPFLGGTHFISVKVECCEFNSACVIGDLEKPIAGRLDISVNNRSIEQRGVYCSVD